ncbi:DUF6328 family protein [Streptomyces sp. NPDC000075]
MRTHRHARLLGPGDRHESCDERADRLWAELLHEVRVALTAVQLLLAFLLAAPFTQVFARLPGTDHLVRPTRLLRRLQDFAVAARTAGAAKAAAGRTGPSAGHTGRGRLLPQI